MLADDAWSIFQGMLLFDMLGTQFTSFTGTKVQILTREPVVDYDIQIIVDDDRGPLLGAGYWSNKVTYTTHITRHQGNIHDAYH